MLVEPVITSVPPRSSTPQDPRSPDEWTWTRRLSTDSSPLDLDQILISSGFWSDFDQTWILIRKQQIPHSRRGDCQDHHHQQHIHHHHPDHHHDETFPVSTAQTGRDFIVNQKLTTLSCCCCYCTVLKTNQTKKLILNQDYLNCFQCTSPPLNWRWTFVFSFKHKFFNLWNRSKANL